MKALHRQDLYCWSEFDAARDVDFHGTLLTLPTGNIAFDPMPISDHDAAHIAALGGVAWVNISNADHVRAAADFKKRFGARIGAPALERDCAEFVGLQVDHWFAADELLDCGISCLPMRGSKTPGEVAFLLPGGDTIVCGDLVRGQRAGALNLLPAAKLRDRDAALQSVRALLEVETLRHVLVGDGWAVFHRGREALLSAVSAVSGLTT